MINKEVLNFIEENDVKFIRLGFCDSLGKIKNISMMANELENIFLNGRPIDTCALKIFSDMTNSDLLLFPDISSLSLLPWRPHTNSVLRFYCDIKTQNGENFSGDGRYILKTATQKLKDLGLTAKVGTKCEFYLFKTDGFDEPTTKTLDNGTYLDVSPLDKGENIRREICLCLEEMGLKPENSYHEQGPGQNRIDFKYSDPLVAADNVLTFKSVVKSISSRNGLFASFMPKPIADKNGSGLSLNISLHKDGKNIFENIDDKNDNCANSFIAGILDKLAEISLFLNPINNSYERYKIFSKTQNISKTNQSNSQVIKIPANFKNHQRIELRTPDATVNPYISLALVLYAGIYGIENNLQIKKDYKCTDLLPKNLETAIELAKNSSFVKQHLGEDFVNSYVNEKQLEVTEFLKTKNKNDYYQNVDFKNL